MGALQYCSLEYTEVKPFCSRSDSIQSHPLLFCDMKSSLGTLPSTSGSKHPDEKVPNFPAYNTATVALSNGWITGLPTQRELSATKRVRSTTMLGQG